jgi:protocatechuate 3,4-dioxygenase beta subunit
MTLNRGGRRELLLAALVMPLTRDPNLRATGPLVATPGCEPAGKATQRETEGPYFKPRSPERTSLVEPGMPGTPLVLTGRVLSTDCQPVAGALLDFWQADAGGDYDNAGFHLRGHQFADADGRYRLLTVVPGLYPGRTRHIHAKVQAPHRPILTTQIYFPGEPHNRADFLFRDDLLAAVETGDRGASGRFDFILDLG